MTRWTSNLPALLPGVVRLGAVVIAASACTGERAAADGARIRDSSGIVIVENADPLTADSTTWVLDTAPRIVIGKTDGPDPYMFGQIAGAVRLDDGRIAVADKQTSEIRFFDSAGVFIEKVGRHGQGPGEFVNFSNMYRTAGDSLIVSDYEGGRYHVLDPRGRYVRTYRLAIKDDVVRRQNTSPQTHATFHDGTMLVTDFMKCASPRQPGVCEDTGRYMRVSERGERLASFGNHVYAREEVLLTTQGRRTYVREWLPPTFWTASGSRFYFADATTFEIRIYSATGALERIVRADLEQLKPPSPLPLPPGLAGRPDPTGALAARRNATVPERLAAFAGFNVDRGGNVWVMEYVPFWVPSSRTTNRWWVFDSTGVLRHTVFVPRIRQTIPWVGGRYRGPEIGEDYILGVRANQDGADEIVLFDLRKRARH